MSNKFTELTSEQVKEKLKAGETIRKAHISRLTLAKHTVDYPISIEESTIGILDFNQSKFSEEISIRRCDIGSIVLSDAEFQQKVNFKKSKISRGRIQRATFQKSANFESTLLSYMSFYQSSFHETANFGRCKFDGDATFTESTFKGNVSFIHTHFTGDGVFKNSTWEGKVDFKNIEVGNGLKLQDCLFKQSIMFNGAVVRLSIALSGSTLEGLTIFSNATVGRHISLNNITVGDNQGFKFAGCSAQTIQLNRETVEGHVYPENEGNFLQASKEYGFLRTAFSNTNRFEDEDWAYYCFKKNGRKGQPLSWNPMTWIKRGVECFFLDWGCGYGTKPFRTLLFSFLLVVAFAVFYFFTYFHAGSVPEQYVSNPVLNNVIYSFDISLVAFSSGYGDLSDLGIKAGSIKLFAILEYMLGMLFAGLFIVAFSRKVIR